MGLLNDQVEETYGGHTVVKSFNHEAADQEVFEKENQQLYEAGWKAQFVSAIIMPLMNFIKNLDYVFVAIIGGIKVANGNMPLGNVQAFLQYTNQFSQPIRQLSNLVNTIQVTIASAERIFEILDEQEMVDQPSNLPVEENTAYKVRFEDVQFGYSRDQLLFTGFSLDVKPAETVAIVGPTGAGKTTLINLLERFYDVSGGSIRYDGVDIRDMSKKKDCVVNYRWFYKIPGYLVEVSMKISVMVMIKQVLLRSKKLLRQHMWMTLSINYQTAMIQS